MSFAYQPRFDEPAYVSMTDEGLDSFELSLGGIELISPVSGKHIGWVGDEIAATVTWCNGKLILADIHHDKGATLEGEMPEFCAMCRRSPDLTQKMLRLAWEDASEQERTDD